MAKSTKMNIALLRKAQAGILKRPELFDMSDWMQAREKDADDMHKGEAVEVCGTTCCLAGEVLVQSGYRLKAVQNDFGMVLDIFKGKVLVDDASDEAQELLNITGEQARNLFHVENWPAAFSAGYGAADKNGEHDLKAVIAASRIDWFIKTAGTDVA